MQGSADGTSFSTIVAPAGYPHKPLSHDQLQHCDGSIRAAAGTGNTVTIPVSGTAADIGLQINSNTGAPGGQVAEFQVFGTGADPGHGHDIHQHLDIGGAQEWRRLRPGFGIWVNEMPEQGQGPAIGSATFNNVTFSDNFQNIKNTTSTFTLNIQ